VSGSERIPLQAMAGARAADAAAQPALQRFKLTSDMIHPGKDTAMTYSCPIPRRPWLKITAAVALALAGAIPLAPPAFSQAAPPPSDKAKQIVALVDKAAALIDSKGEAAFAEFRKAGSEWMSGNTYLFVNDLTGNTLFHGALPELEGTSALGLKDSDGKLFFVEMVDVVKSKGSGWVHYMWPKPGYGQASEKWSYVKAVTIDGAPAMVGSGFYPQ
jgi:cytochrome c